MCGIVGFWSDPAPIGAEQITQKMVASLHHRGPNDRGALVTANHRLWLGHARLSVVDLSPHGHQPMASASGRYQVVYNGEIYNHQSLRTELEESGWSFRGHSDTEVILAAFEQWGIEESLQKMIGMFAFAVWDQEREKLTLVRDRMGEKPLYYGISGKTFLFASELKAIKQHPQFSAELNREALTGYFRFGYIPAPLSIYQGIFKLLPGHLITIDADSLKQLELPLPLPYWQLVSSLKKDPEILEDADAVEQLDELLQKSVGQQMVADVPVGCFLSGGIDSSTIAAVMQSQSKKPVSTFSIGFDESEFDEAPYAKAVAKHLGTSHTELYVSPDEARSVIPLLPEVYDEPFADSSQIPTYLVSKLARSQVTVSLSGDGGDELFGGYSRYVLTQGLWSKISPIPTFMRRTLGSTLASLDSRLLNLTYQTVQPFLGNGLRLSHPAEKLRKASRVLDARNAKELYWRLISLWDQPEKLVINGTEPTLWALNSVNSLEELDGVSEFMTVDSLLYLPDDILVKVDRAAMAVSLENRVPLLDHRLVEWATRLPLHQKIRNGQGKWILRQVLNRYVPMELINRPKQGFGVPIDTWLRGPLTSWAKDLLSAERIKQQGILNDQLVTKRLNEHLSGTKDWQHQLWAVLMFQAWWDFY